MDLADRIKQLIIDKNVTPYVIYKEAGISQATISTLTNRKTLSLNGKNLEVLSKYFGVNKEWLRSGKGEKLPAATFTDADCPCCEKLKAENEDLKRLLQEKEKSIEDKDKIIRLYEKMEKTQLPSKISQRDTG